MIKYRPEIDGLRAIAVLPVILYHAKWSGFSGGFLGVDVFFVISGFLISSIMFSELRTGQFSITQFYHRRIKRILPVFSAVLLCTLVAGWYWLTPSELKELGESISSSSLFYSNYHFYENSGYFDTAADLIPLLHTWSLSIEEQFYIVLPPLMLIGARLGALNLGRALLFLWILSFGICVYSQKENSTAAFYLIQNRAWELLTGVLGAFYLKSIHTKVSTRWHGPLTNVGLILIVTSISVMDSTWNHPGWPTLIPVLGAILILLFGEANSVAKKVLTFRGFIGVGLISYSLYLWHYPVFSLFKLRNLSAPDDLETAWLLLTILAASVLSWKFIEVPFRKKLLPSEKASLRFSLVVALLGFGIGYLITQFEGIPGRFPEIVQRAFAYSGDRARNEVQSDGQKCHERDPKEACVIGDKTATANVALVGDSHADTISAVISDTLMKSKMAGLHFSQSSCPFISVGDYGRKFGKGCEFANREIEKRLTLEKISTVIYSSRFAIYASGTRFDNLEGGLESGKPFKLKGVNLSPNEQEDLVLSEFQQTIEKLLASGVKVLLIYPIPEVGWNSPSAVGKRLIRGDQDPVSTSFEVFQARNFKAFEYLNKIPPNENLVRILPHLTFCDSFKPGRCVVEMGDEVFYYDSHHLSRAGARKILDGIEF